LRMRNGGRTKSTPPHLRYGWLSLPVDRKPLVLPQRRKDSDLFRPSVQVTTKKLLLRLHSLWTINISSRKSTKPETWDSCTSQPVKTRTATMRRSTFRKQVFTLTQ